MLLRKSKTEGVLTNYIFYMIYSVGSEYSNNILASLHHPVHYFCLK